MKELRFEIPEGHEIDFLKSDFPKCYVAFRKKELDLPKTWADLKNISGYFIGDTCNIESEKGVPHATNKNVFCTYPQAKASLALAQLSQLRGIYRQGWTPDWTDNLNKKWCVLFHGDKLIVDTWFTSNQFLSFQSKEIAQEFLTHFHVLIIQARPLMS